MNTSESGEGRTLNRETPVSDNPSGGQDGQVDFLRISYSDVSDDDDTWTNGRMGRPGLYGGYDDLDMTEDFDLSLSTSCHMEDVDSEFQDWSYFNSEQPPGPGHLQPCYQYDKDKVEGIKQQLKKMSEADRKEKVQLKQRKRREVKQVLRKDPTVGLRPMQDDEDAKKLLKAYEEATKYDPKPPEKAGSAFVSSKSPAASLGKASAKSKDFDKAALPIKKPGGKGGRTVRFAVPGRIDVLAAAQQSYGKPTSTGLPKHVVAEMTSEEIEDLRIIFDTFDARNRGFIDASDLKRAMKALGFKKLGPRTFASMIAEIDETGSGQVTFPQFLSFVVASQREGPDPAGEIKQAFKMFDTDDKGYVTENDVRHLADEYGVKLSNRQLQQMLHEADQNGDRKVSLDEFIDVILQTNIYRHFKETRDSLPKKSRDLGPPGDFIQGMTGGYGNYPSRVSSGKKK